MAITGGNLGGKPGSSGSEKFPEKNGGWMAATVSPPKKMGEKLGFQFVAFSMVDFLEVVRISSRFLLMLHPKQTWDEKKLL